MTRKKTKLMTTPTPKKKGSLLRTVLIGLLIIFTIALILGTLTVMFP